MAGRLEIICGPVGSGKSAEIGRRLSLLRNSGVQYLLFRPDLQNSMAEAGMFSQTAHADAIKTANDSSAVEFMLHISEKFPEADVIAVDGANFYHISLIGAVESWAGKKRVVCAGLDTDFTGRPFETMAMLMGMADDVTKLTAICARCKAPASRSQLVEIDATMPHEIAESMAYYEPRCRQCHEIPKTHKPVNNLRWMLER